MTREVRSTLGPPDATAFGRLLRFWRGVFRESQEDLAFALDSSPRHISRLENGRVQPSRALVERIASHWKLGARDTAHLLLAAGHPPAPRPVDFHALELRWLRKATARILSALDPFPSMLSDGLSQVLLVNRSWLGLLGPHLDLGRPPSLREYYGFLLASMADRPGLRDVRCGLLMTLQQEALIRDDPRLQELVDGLAREHAIPGDWPERAARFEPTASFPVELRVAGEPTRFFHVSYAISPHGPSTFPAATGLAVFSLLPDDLERDWSFLIAHSHTPDHPALCTKKLS